MNLQDNAEAHNGRQAFAHLCSAQSANVLISCMFQAQDTPGRRKTACKHHVRDTGNVVSSLSLVLSDQGCHLRDGKAEL